MQLQGPYKRFTYIRIHIKKVNKMHACMTTTTHTHTHPYPYPQLFLPSLTWQTHKVYLIRVLGLHVVKLIDGPILISFCALIGRFQIPHQSMTFTSLLSEMLPFCDIAFISRGLKTVKSPDNFNKNHQIPCRINCAHFDP